MLGRFHWSLLIAGVAIFGWWSFFANVEEKGSTASLYTHEHFQEDVSKIYSDIARAALKRGDFSKALQSYREVVTLRPTFLEGYDRLGTTYELNNQPDEALKTYAQAMNINPNFIDYRFKQSKKEHTLIPPIQPTKSVEWTGQELIGKKIFVYAERSITETLLFFRFLLDLQKKGATVYFKPQMQLFNLIKQSKLGILLCNHQTNIPNLDVDYHISLLGLQHYLAPTVESLEVEHKESLKVSPEKIFALSKTIFNNNDFKIGLVCQSSVARPGMPDTSIPLSMFEPLTQISGTKIYLLQKNIPSNLSGQHFIAIGDQLKDFTDTAAAVSNLDLIITLDPALAALAGMLNKQVWLFIPTQQEWYWLNYWDKTKTVWFPSITKFQQGSNRRWDTAIDLMISKLKTRAIK